MFQSGLTERRWAASSWVRVLNLESWEVLAFKGCGEVVMEIVKRTYGKEVQFHVYPLSICLSELEGMRTISIHESPTGRSASIAE